MASRMNTRRAVASSLFLLAPLLAAGAAAVSLTACGGKVDSSTNGTTSGGATTGLSGGDVTNAKSFPLGTYSNCTWLVNGNTFEGEGGPTTTLTLAANGASITGTYVSDGATQATLSLVPTSALSATAATAGQAIGGKWGDCGAGSQSETLPDGGTEYLISDPGPSPATLAASSVDVTVAGGTLFLTATGPVIDVLGFPGCAPNTPPAVPINAVLECGTAPSGDASSDATAAAPTTRTGEAAAAPTFAPGVYDCTDTTSTVVTVSGTTDNAGEGGAATVTLTKAGTVLTAALSGDAYVSGALTFDAVSGNAAIAADGQSINVACGAFSPSDPASTANPAATHVTSASLTTDGTTLTLVALGNVTAPSCSGQTSSTVLTCTPKK